MTEREICQRALDECDARAQHLSFRVEGGEEALVVKLVQTIHEGRRLSERLREMDSPAYQARVELVAQARRTADA